MTQQELARKQNGDISFRRFQNLKLLCQSRSYGVSNVTGHSYKNTQLCRNPEKFIIFQYTFQGVGELLLNGERYMVPEGKAFLLFVPSNSIYMQSPDAALYHFIYISMFGDMAMEIAQKIIKKCGMVLTIRPDSKALEMLCEHFNKIIAYPSSRDIYDEANFTYSFLLTLLKEQENNALAIRKEMPDMVKNILSYIDQNLADPSLNLSRMAATAQLSVFYFTRLFKKYLFTPPQKYLQARRLSYAAQLLENEYSMPLKIIIEQCGFFNESHFCYLFRKTYGMSPGEYRRQFKYTPKTE
ncbi:MAG: AraC family transcriptional regulator [Lentisphaeria bacterium]|nr:AraC family transcriptional regulator [Lentisphaeria bacterium]